MIWGNTQEATALLTALNYFWKQDSRIVLREVGMCGAGLALNHTSTATSTGMLIGATPDALLLHPDGRVEAVEVKNHCPFQPNFMSKRTTRFNNNGRGQGRFRISRQEFTHEVMPQYVPQLMMEMLCVGPECDSAIMVRQSAVNGALILRIHRDDEWIEEMLYWLNRFHHDFVKPRLPPPPNFFFRTGSSAEQRHVPHNEVQRAMGSVPGSTNLFLDL